MWMPFLFHIPIDHYNDAEILIESITKGMREKYGTLICSESVLNGYKNWGPSISSYHQAKSDKLILKADTLLEINGIKFKGTKTIHNDPTCVGFQIDYNGFKLSYTSDTNYFDGLADYHNGTDILIGNIGRPGNDFIEGHLSSCNFVDLINEIKPKLAIMNHFGLKMISANPDSEAEKISKKTDTNVIAAYDGLSLNIDYKNPEKFEIHGL